MKSNHKAFTLIELLVVIAIISLLSSIVLASINTARSKARDAVRISDFKQIQTALELFYNQTGKYPMSPGHATWSGHWANFAQCLETGVGCGFAITNYKPVISKMPQDPSRKTTDPFADDIGYIPAYYADNSGCGDGSAYLISATLENNNSVLASDLDVTPSVGPNSCLDSNLGYCVGAGSCPGGW